jgi:glycosyltransferase involved in cell wall biosynthesis
MAESQRLKVAIFSQYFPPDLGGSMSRAFNVAKGLVLNGCDVTVISAFPHYPYGNIPRKYRWKPVVVEWKDNIRIIRTFILPLKSEGFVKRLLLMGIFGVSAFFGAIFVRDAKVIWGSSWLTAVFLGKLSHRPVVLNVDDLTIEDVGALGLMEENSFFLKVARVVFTFFYRQGNAITPVSPGYVDVISKTYGVPRSRIHVVRAGVDLSTFKIKDETSRHEKFRVLYSGALSVAHDFDQVLSAARILKDEAPDVEFVIQGGGEHSEHISKAIREAALNNVIFINKIISREEVANLLNSADALLLPLKDFGRPYLGLSTKLYEYQAIGKPIICCDDGQPADYVKDTNSGLVVKSGDYMALAKAIVFLKNNPDFSQDLGENGRKYVENNLSIAVIGMQMKRLLVSMCVSK